MQQRLRDVHGPSLPRNGRRCGAAYAVHEGRETESGAPSEQAMEWGTALGHDRTGRRRPRRRREALATLGAAKHVTSHSMGS